MTESEKNKVENLINDLLSDNGIIRQMARHNLVKIGHNAIEPLYKLLSSPKHMTRWEAIKAIEQMGDPYATPYLIAALQDDKFDIRWIAAEGLIRIGIPCLKPLMKQIVEDSDSVFIREGAHHILKDFESKGIFVDKFGIIDKLENLSDISSLHVIAEKYLQ